MLRVDGSLIHVEYAAMPFEMDGTTAVQVVIRDVTEKKKQDEYIRYLALHDKLTGLPNRELLADRILKAMKRRGRDSLKNAVIYLDLDAFKPINDTLGHDAGDKALQEIAVRLEDSIRASDTAARIGGDEFVILLEGVTGLEEISAVAERILEKINEPLNIDDHEFLVGASLGVSVYPDDSQDHSDLMSMADKAMYYVKETGKNRYAFYADIPGKL
jgi:diguanylate cyclase (GGDEF)-like protein